MSTQFYSQDALTGDVWTVSKKSSGYLFCCSKERYPGASFNFSSFYLIVFLNLFHLWQTVFDIFLSCLLKIITISMSKAANGNQAPNRKL